MAYWHLKTNDLLKNIESPWKLKILVTYYMLPCILQKPF